jgi:hypothetical protein
MTSVNEAPLSRFARPDAWRLLKNLLGGIVILAVWLALWTWLAAGVLRPLSAVPRLSAERAAASDAI